MPQPYILLAEDDLTIGEMMRLTLEESGYAVRSVRDGAETLAAVEERAPVLLFLDLLMPKKDGYAVLESLRESGHAFPVVVLSNLSDDRSRQRCTALGAASYFVKSNMDEEALLDLVKEYARRA
ncbi:MAG: response regulator [Candidatus Peribacteraceae bacterium]|jgi:CheY-like chemotaxis protein